MRSGGHRGEQPNALAAYTVILLRHGEHYLMLRRSETKRFAPGRWTGLGGRVEADELGDLRAAALRELSEETGIVAADVDDFVLRRVLLHSRPGMLAPLTVLLYFAGVLRTWSLPQCSEGTLEWVTAESMRELDIIDNTREVVRLLIGDLARDPEGSEPAKLGVAHYRADGVLARIVWASDVQEWTVRAGDERDFSFLRQMLYEAAFWRPYSPRPSLVDALADQHIARYIRDWGRTGDAAMVAVDTDGRPIGAAWYRLFTADEPGYGFVDDATPELSLAVLPEYRRRGIGRALLDALLQHARAAGYKAISLSVDRDNPARSLYERSGFVKVGEHGSSWTMRLDLGTYRR